MERWDSVLDSYNKGNNYLTGPTMTLYARVLHTATDIVKKDLAIFEVEYLTDSLLYNPVNLLTTISEKRDTELWSKNVGDSFKLLTELINRYGEVIEKYFEDIVTICHPFSQYDTTSRQQCIACLTAVCKRSSMVGAQLNQYVDLLRTTTTCRAPVATLIGTICEYHPNTVADDVNGIWRTFLSQLESNKNTDKVTSSVFQAIKNLFKHHGSDLPTAELNEFYDKMTSNTMYLAKCKDLCMEILGDHGDLFKEKLSKDVRTRKYLETETRLKREYSRHLYSVYCVICEVFKDDNIQIQNLISSEIIPLINSDRSHMKYLALRIFWHIKNKYGVGFGDDLDTDIHTLDFELRNGVITYDVAEAIIWCIESNVPYSDKLLQSSVLFYQNIPTARVREIVVYGILKADDRVRKETVIFLTQESAQEFQKYIKIWSYLFDTNNGNDVLVLEKSKFVFEDFLTYTVSVLDGYLDEDEIIPDKVKCLIKLYRYVSSLHRTVEMTDFESDHPLLTRNKPIRIDVCRTEEELCEACIDIIETDFCQNNHNVLKALQVIFSRNDVEPKTLTLALRKLEKIIANNKNDFENYTFSEIIISIENLRNRKDLTCKEGRILQKDVLMFLGKFSNRTVSNYQMDKEENTLIVNLQELILNVLNPHEGFTYKINLQKILHQALIHDNADVLMDILKILCSNLSQRVDPIQQQVLTAVIKSLTKVYCHSDGLTKSDAILNSVNAAVVFCDSIECVGMFLNYISGEVSPGVRKMLSDLLEVLLTKDQGSSPHETLVNTVAEHAVVLMNTDCSTTKRAGLNITEILLISLKDNHQLTLTLLPKLIINVANTLDIDADVTLKIATESFVEKVELFDQQIVENLIKDLIKILFRSVDDLTDDNTFKCYKKTVKISVLFLNKIYEYYQYEKIKIVENVFAVYDEGKSDLIILFYLLTEIKIIFEFTSVLSIEIVHYKDSFVLNQLFCMENKMYEKTVCMELILLFIEEFAQSMLEFQYQKTSEFLSEIIMKFTPESVQKLRKRIQSCFTNFLKKYADNIPNVIISKYDEWCAKLPLADITKNLEKVSFKSEHAVAVNSLKIMMEIFKMAETSNLTVGTQILTEVKSSAKIWIRQLLQWFSRGYMKGYLKNELPYLTDVLTVAVNCQNLTDLKAIILEGHNLKSVSNENVGVEFVIFFMDVFFDLLVSKPFLLVDEDMAACCLLLNEVALYAVKKKISSDVNDNILDLVKELWLTYEKKSTFEQKYNLLLNLNSFPKKLVFESDPMQWACSVVTTESPREDKAKIIGVLPGGREFASTYRRFAGILPLRPSEWRRGAAAVIAAIPSDIEILEIVTRQAQSDHLEEWWLHAVEQALAGLSVTDRLTECCELVYRLAAGVSATARILVPILRYSTGQFCERFLSTKIKELLSILERCIKTPSAHYSYKEMIAKYIRVFYILQVAFVKIPPHVLESPHSLLYSELKPQKSWHLVRETCRLSFSLRGKVKCVDDSVKELYRTFHTANYNCLAAAISVWRANERIYECVFAEQAWCYIVDCELELKLELKGIWNQRTRRQVTSIDIPIDVNMSLSTLSLSRTRHFVNTLSENPLQYDFLTDYGDTMATTQEIVLPDNELNSMECSATLTSLLCHAVSLPHNMWLDSVVSTLKGSAHRNVKYFLAQCVCNSKEALIIHKDVLTPALLQLIVDTTEGTLNSLHVDVLETILHWSCIPSTVNLSNLVSRHLIHTCLGNRHRTSVYARLFGLIKEVVKWGISVDFGVVEGFLTDTTNNNLKTIEVLTVLAKAKVQMLELLPHLTTMFDSCQNLKLSKVTQLFGAGLTASKKDVTAHVFKFRKHLDTIRRADVSEYIRMLYYAQMEYDKCCDEKNYRSCLDLLTKLPASEKKKCLKILISYMPVLDEAELKALFEVVRTNGDLETVAERDLVKMAVFGLTVLYKDTGRSSTKKPRLSTSPILQHYDSKDPYIIGIICSVRDGVIKGDILSDLVAILSDDLGVRFLESFILAIYLPMQRRTQDKGQDLSVCMSAFLHLFLSGIMEQERFKTIQLCDKPLGLSKPTTSRLMSMSKSYQGSFSRSISGVRQTNTSKKSDIDVEVTLYTILENIIAFCKTTQLSGQEMFLQLFKIMIPHSGFDSELIAKLINTTLSKPVNEMFPTVMEMSRIVINDVLTVSGFEDSIQQLKSSTQGTEGEFHTNLLYEEIKLRSNGNEQFVLGCMKNLYGDDVCMEEDSAFNMKALTKLFGKLSNWDDITIGKRKLVKSDLSPLWTDRQTAQRILYEFDSKLEGPTWLQRLTSALKEERENTVKWLRGVDKWPRRYFDISSVTEAVMYLDKQTDNAEMLTCDIQKHECMAEWAARLMIRSAHLYPLDDRNMRLSRSHELKWCERANEMALSNSVLECVGRNFPDICESESLQWYRQKVLALRTMALEKNDRSLLEKYLNDIEKFKPQFRDASKPGVLIDMCILSLKLQNDLKETSKEKLQNSVQEAYKQHQILSTGFIESDKQKLSEFYEIAIAHYDNLCKDVPATNTSLSSMIDILEKTQDLNLGDMEAILAVVLNRVKPIGLIDNEARRLLYLIENMKSNLTEFTLQQIRLALKVLPSHVLNEFSFARERDGSISKYKKCFQLVCDPEYLLAQYFDDMKKYLERNELDEWKRLHLKLKEYIFDNPYAGSDYVLLKKYKNMLIEIDEFVSKSPYEALPLMLKCQKSLTPKIVAFVRLSQLSPTLVRDSSPDRDLSLARLMGLSPGVTVVKFHEQVQVITSSVRRPVIIKALLSNGQVKKILHKSGAVMNCEAAPQGVMKTANRIWRKNYGVYNVTPLSEDSALIEYLEDHETVRSLISGQYDLDALLKSTQRGADDALIMSPQISLQQHNLLCDKVPSYTLRSAIEIKSASLQDFIGKKRMFLESLASAAVFTWLLGVGDRHLENILYSIKDGSLCCIDWGEILQFGSREMPPARLTRNLLAVCDMEVLESHITKLWTKLRESHTLVLSVIKLSFTWMGSGFDDKLPYIESQLNGASTSYQTNKQIMEGSTKKNKEKYKELLEEVFGDLVEKDCYSVEEQVTCFLRHCTDPRILSVTRLNWEPWV